MPIDNDSQPERDVPVTVVQLVEEGVLDQNTLTSHESTIQFFTMLGRVYIGLALACIAIVAIITAGESRS